jgi:hypothetical protein
MITNEALNAKLLPGLIGRGQATASPSDSATLDPCLLMFTESGTVAFTGDDGVDATIAITIPTDGQPYIHPVIVKKVKLTGTTAPNLQLIML